MAVNKGKGLTKAPLKNLKSLFKALRHQILRDAFGDKEDVEVDIYDGAKFDPDADMLNACPDMYENHFGYSAVYKDGELLGYMKLGLFEKGEGYFDASDTLGIGRLLFAIRDIDGNMMSFVRSTEQPYMGPFRMLQHLDGRLTGTYIDPRESGGNGIFSLENRGLQIGRYDKKTGNLIDNAGWVYGKIDRSKYYLLLQEAPPCDGGAGVDPRKSSMISFSSIEEYAYFMMSLDMSVDWEAVMLEHISASETHGKGLSAHRRWGIIQ